MNTQMNNNDNEQCWFQVNPTADPVPLPYDNTDEPLRVKRFRIGEVEYYKRKTTNELFNLEKDFVGWAYNNTEFKAVPIEYETDDEEEEEEDEEENCPPCCCTTKIDIRGRCDAIRSAPQFAKCPARIDTALFHIENDYQIDQELALHRDIEYKSKIIARVASEAPYNFETGDVEKIVNLYRYAEEKRIEEEEEKEEKKPKCYGKHCDETEGLKKGIGWNRYNNCPDLITEPYFKEFDYCEYCYNECCNDWECCMCKEKMMAKDLQVKRGGPFGDGICWEQVFCQSCIISIKATGATGDEWI